jgi:hypothetical protein
MSLHRCEPPKLTLFVSRNPSRKRYDIIALLLKTVPKAHHNLAKPIIALNSSQAIITGDLLCGRYAKSALFLFSQELSSL